MVRWGDRILDCMSTDTKELDDLKLSKEDLFIDAWFANKFNGAKAARIAFDIGSKGGKSDNTAGAIGAEYLRKPSVIAKIRRRMDTDTLSKEWVVKQLQRHAEGKASRVSLGALDRLGHVLGLELTAPQGGGQLQAPSVNITFGLNSPVSSSSPALDSPDVIEAKVSEDKD